MLSFSQKIKLVTATVILTLSFNYLQGQVSNGQPLLSSGFIDPPTSVRPWAYWVWTNGNVNYSVLTKDLEELKSKGLGGFDIFDVGERFPETGEVPAGPAFLGKESVEAINYSVKEAGRLGLGLGLIASSSWNAGGSWVKPEYANMALYSSEQIILKGPIHYSNKLPFPAVPEKAPKRPDGMPAFYKEVAVIAFPKSNDKIITDISTVKVLSGFMDKDGILNWDVPEGEWVITRFICSNTGKMLHSPSLNSGGLVIDHFNPEATEMHFQTVIDKLIAEMGHLDNTALKYLYLCSYEVWGISWTPKFQDEFLKRRGYDINPYLPVMMGMTVQNEEITKRFNYDFKKTICDLIVDAHYKNATKISNKYGLQLCSESGGPGPVPVEALKALGALDIPRGEFWYDSPTSLIKEIASAAHIYGKKIVDQESFPSWVFWQEGPYDLKPIADRSFCQGMNRLVFHTYSHNPPEAGLPGWSYYAGTNIGPTRVWWPKVKPFMDYLSRCSYLLREGLFVGDVCYYYGDRGYNFVPEKHIDPSLGPGFDYDVTNPEVILTRMSARNGKIVLPDGMKYELLVLPDTCCIDLDVLKKVEELVKSGITVVGPKPTGTTGLTNYPSRDAEVKKLADKIWGACDGKNVKEQAYGKGKIIWGQNLREILQKRGVGPDFSFVSRNNGTNLDYIHRQTDKEDIYFVINKNKTSEYVDCTFRVKGKIPELWNPETGNMHNALVYKSVNQGTMVSLSLPPQGSIFIVFSKMAGTDHVVSVKRNDNQLFPISLNQLVKKDDDFNILSNEGNQPVLLTSGDGLYAIETANGKSKMINVEKLPESIQISGSWEIRFPFGWGAPVSKILPKLISWTEDSEDGIKYFSGIATYYKDFELPGELIKEGNRIILDLGDVKLLSDVYLNGNHIGILWKSPFTADITNALKPGKNHLIVEVANTWSNRLTGDGKLPENQRYTHTNIKNIGGPLKKGPLWKDVPLLESGLLGPVRLIFAKEIKVNL